MLVQRIEDAAMGNEQERVVWVPRHPLGDHRRYAVEDFPPGIGVWRKDRAGGLVWPQAVLLFDLADDATVEAPEVPLYEPPINMDRLLQLLSNDPRRGECPDHRARDYAINCDLREPCRRGMRLSDPGRVEWDVRLALVPALAVPVGLAVSQEVEGPLRNHARMKPDGPHLFNWSFPLVHCFAVRIDHALRSANNTTVGSNFMAQPDWRNHRALHCTPQNPGNVACSGRYGNPQSVRLPFIIFSDRYGQVAHRYGW
jgi:hypothetical protein